MQGFTSLGQMLLAVRARWMLAALVAAGVFLTVLIATAFISPSYRATADVIFNSRANDAIVDRGDGTSFNAYMTAEIELMSSERVLRRLTGDPAFLNAPATRALLERRGIAPAAAPRRLAALIDSSLTVGAVKNSRTVSVAVLADDPEFAALAANGVAQAYLATNVDLRVAPARANVAFFRAQRATRAADLTRARASLDAFLKRTGLTGREAISDADDTQLRALAQSRTASQAQLAASSAEAAVGSVAAGVSAGAISNSVVQQLRSEIAQATATLADLTVLRGPNFPSVVQARERLNELRAQLATETGRIAEGLRRRSASAGIEASRMGALESGLRASMSASAATRSQLAGLTGEVERAKVNYDTVNARLAEVELASSLEQPNAAVLSRAAPPLRPAAPSWPLSILVGIAGGLLAGIAAALFAELRQPRVRSWRDVELALGAPVLCDMAS